ncbi:MAG: hypothetical protein WCT12_20675 [Verrucomicrobiota bacterium]
MTITPGGGVITWPTSDARANSTNTVVVRLGVLATGGHQPGLTQIALAV